MEAVVDEVSATVLRVASEVRVAVTLKLESNNLFIVALVVRLADIGVVEFTNALRATTEAIVAVIAESI